MCIANEEIYRKQFYYSKPLKPKKEKIIKSKKNSGQLLNILDVEPTNEYEELRYNNVKRNYEHMKSLGL